MLKASDEANFPELKIENPVDPKTVTPTIPGIDSLQPLYDSFVSPAWARLNYGTNPNNLDEEGNARVWGAFDLLPGW